MPQYTYQCIDCNIKDVRIAAVDDHTALCVACGGLMLRLDVDVFEPYFPSGGDNAQEPPKDPNCSWCMGPDPEVPTKSHGVCKRHAQLWDEP